MVSSNYKLFSKIAAVTIFSFMVAGAVLVFKTDNDKIVTKQKFENEKVLILKKLNRLQDSIGIVMNQNNDYKTELVNQNLKIASLIAKINGSNVATNDISDIKKDYSSEMASLRNEVASLRNSNASLIQQNNNYRKDIAALKSGQKPSPSLSLQSKSEVLTNNAPAEIENNNVKLKDETISKILVSNLKTTTFNIDKSGFMQASDKSNKANIVKVNFEVSGNKNVNFLFKEYYIQIIDVNNNVIGLRKTKKFGKSDLTYSASYPLTFKNETVETTTNIDLIDAEKGTYYVNIFDNDRIMSKSTFVLK